MVDNMRENKRLGALHDTFVYERKISGSTTSIVVPAYAWKFSSVTFSQGDKVEQWCAGTLDELEEISRLFIAGNLNQIEKILRECKTAFGLILRVGERVLAICDRVQSYPLFVETQNSTLISVTADGRFFRDALHGKRLREDALQTFAMTGYCLGSETLVDGVRRLRPGEICVGEHGEYRFFHYYQYRPTFSRAGIDSATLRRELGETLDAIISEFVEKANGRKVLLSLSAGFDSRLLLGKLVEHGCRDLITFSYGTNGNMESREAKRFAEQLGVPWMFIPTDETDIEDYRSGQCVEFMRFAGGVHTTPVMTEYFALKRLSEMGYSRQNSILLNGQTGDFLSGGHLVEVTGFFELSQVIYRKHFSLKYKLGEFPDDMLDNSELKRWADNHQFSIEDIEGDDLHCFNICFEWQERQANYVVNQQRAYDWFSMDWFLPLWHPLLMDFYESVPSRLQLDQKLYIEYLQEWNYKGIFDKLRTPYDPWPKYKLPVQITGRFLGIALGRRAKDKFYQLAQYISDQYYLYRFFNGLIYLKHYESIRNPATLFTVDSLVSLKRDMGIVPDAGIETELADALGR